MHHPRIGRQVLPRLFTRMAGVGIVICNGHGRYCSQSCAIASRRNSVQCSPAKEPQFDRTCERGWGQAEVVLLLEHAGAVVPRPFAV